MWQHSLQACHSLHSPLAKADVSISTTLLVILTAATIIALPTACRAATTADRGVVRYLAVPPW